MGKKSVLPEYHVLDFFYDDEDACALTVRMNHAQFHIIVDPSQFNDYSSGGGKIAKEYKRLLNLVKSSEGEDKAGNGTSDSGVDVRSSADGDEDPSLDLHEWILSPMEETFKTKAPVSKRPDGQTVQDFYHCPTSFYQIEVKDGTLRAKEDKDPSSLEKRIKALLPNLPLPKYLRDFNIPTFRASDLLVQADSANPAPIHPTLVNHGDRSYFIKMVDINQLQPTKREIRIMKEIEEKGIHKRIRMPLVRGVVRFDEQKDGNIMGFLMDAIEDAQPLTYLLDAEVPQEKRERWADECRRMVDVLHEHGIVWGDAKGDNFMVDKHDKLWIIDFGGSYTEGWIDPELRDTEAGDEMGTQKVVNALHDPEGNTYGPNEPITSTTLSESRTRRGKRRHSEAEQSEDESNSMDTKTRKQVKRNSKSKDLDKQTDLQYCFCDGTGSGEMVACDGPDCVQQWFHFSCVGLAAPPSSKEWFCEDCRD